MSVGRHLEARDTYIQPPRPPSVGVAIPELPVAGAEIAVDIVAVEGAQKVGYDVPEGVPAPPSGYSPAVRYGDWVGLAGELATDWQGAFMSDRHLGPPTTSAPEARPNPYFWYGLPVEAQAAYVLKKQDLIARSAGTSFDRCVKATVYVGHPADFYSVERVWKQYFPEDPPARVVVPYVGFGGKGARVEIAMELLAGDSDLVPERIVAADAPRPFAHEAQAVRAGDFLFLSTQLPVDSDGRLAADATPKPALRHYAQPAKLQMQYLLRNIAAICEAAGTSLDNVCRIKLFMDDYACLAPATDELASWFASDPPALSTYRLGSGPLLAPGVHLMADVVAYAPR
jgi:enamine deaminase RidA (YjgF/YER057c/UK114 family)